eukprot:366710_1
MQFVREFGIIDDEYDAMIDNIKAKAESDTDAFSKSDLYSTEKSVIIIDETLRKSQWKHIKDDVLFAMTEKFVNKLSKMDNYYNFMLVKNDITFIKYSKGGFFSKHQDFINLKSNLLEEFTLIICIDAKCEGGETMLYFSNESKHKSLCSTTPKHALLFRKDIFHEGLMINNGYKHILMVNLFAFKKGDNYQQRNVVIKCRDNENNPIIIPLNNILELKSTKLYRAIKTQIDNTHDNKSLIIYQEKLIGYKLFYDVFSKIYNRSYLPIDDLKKYEKEIIGYGFNYSNILIDDEKQIEQHNKAKEQLKNFKATSIILCDNNSEQLFMLNTIKTKGLMFVPFKLMLYDYYEQDVWKEYDFEQNVWREYDFEATEDDDIDSNSNSDGEATEDDDIYIDSNSNSDGENKIGWLSFGELD